MALSERPTDEQPRESMDAQWERAQTEMRALGASVAAITEEVRELARKEMALARAEVQENVGLARHGAMFGGAAGMLGLLALGFLGLAAMYGLGEVLPLWASALIVAGVLVSGVVIFGLMARSALSAMQLVPQHTLRSLGEDMRWAREQLKRNSR